MTIQNNTGQGPENRFFLINSGVTAAISGLTISGSNNETSGGGILNSGNLTITNLNILNNSTRGNGGGIFSNSGSLKIINSTISKNDTSFDFGGKGGGLWLVNTNTMLINTTISNNEAFGGQGGGIYNKGGVLTITSSTIATNNTITSSGGASFGAGIYAESGSVSIHNSIIAANNGVGGDFWGTITSQGYNLIGKVPSAGYGILTGDMTGNIVGTDANPVSARFAPLTFYGGQTLTKSLRSNSPAVNAGDPTVSTPDQRGAARVGRADIGAFELNNSQNGGNFVAVLPDGIIGNPYEFMLFDPYPLGSENRASPPFPDDYSFTFELTGGAMPDGITLKVTDRTNQRLGFLSIKGETTMSGNFNFSITTAKNESSGVTDYSLRMLVPPPPPVECVVNPVVVNRLNDTAGSLRQAVRDACPGSTITFSNNLRGVILLTTTITVDNNLTIKGPGANELTLQKAITLEGEPQPPSSPHRMFYTGSGVTISGLTISGANMSNGSIDFVAIQNFGSLTISDSSIINHKAGGAIISNGNLTVNNSTISNNSGIGIAHFGGTLTVNNSIITKNASYGSGGGIRIKSGNLIINNSTVSKNLAFFSGGGISFSAVSGNTATITNTTISYNQSAGNTLFGGGSGGGGGIYQSGGVLSVTNSTVVNNVSSSGTADFNNLGGGIYNDIFSGNGTTYMRNSIVAGNLRRAIGSSGFASDSKNDFYGRLTSQGYNLIGTNKDTTITGDTTGNIVGTDANPVNPQIAPLGFYGGPTLTHALFSNSPAVNAGDPTVSTPDQRGAARVGRPDIGAFEVNNQANGGNFVAVLPDGLINIPYAYTLVPDRGVPTYTLTGGTLPTGVSLVTDGANVSIKGTTNMEGVFNFSVTATDGGSSTVTDYRVSFAQSGVTPTPTPTPTATPTPTPTPTTNNGFFEFADCSSISGWAWDQQQPDTPVDVNIYADDNLVATVSADQFRQDLLDAGIGNGVHGFSLATPAILKDGQPHQIRVQIASTASELNDSPRSITCLAPPPQPTVTPICNGTVSSVNVSWSEAGRGAQGYSVDISASPDFSQFVNKFVPSGTTSTTFGSEANLQGGTTYYVRVYYHVTQEHSPTANFTANTCSHSIAGAVSYGIANPGQTESFVSGVNLTLTGTANAT
ncbi:MAG: choice-of-anchor Q domain-containing protein, partial [Aridibacter sp.]